MLSVATNMGPAWLFLLLFSPPKAAAAFASMLPPLPFWITEADINGGLLLAVFVAMAVAVDAVLIWCKFLS